MRKDEGPSFEAGALAIAQRPFDGPSREALESWTVDFDGAAGPEAARALPAVPELPGDDKLLVAGAGARSYSAGAG